MVAQHPQSPTPTTENPISTELLRIDPDLQITTKEKRDDKLSRDAARRIAMALVADPLYLAGLQDRLRKGKVAPAVEVHLWHMAYGKPKEQVEIRKATAVKIIHSYADDLGEKIAKEVIEGDYTVSESADQDREDAVERTTDTVPEK